MPSSLLAMGYAGDSASEHEPGVSRRTDRAGDEVLLTTDGISECLAFNREGRAIWRTTVPGRSRVELFAPLEDGGILALSTDEGLTRLTGEGQVLWTVDLAVHHELAPASNGAFLTATHSTHNYRGRRVRFDAIQRVSPTGTLHPVLDLFALKEQLCPLGSPSPLDEEAQAASESIYDRFHLNSIQVLPESDLGRRDARFAPGNLLLCLRNADLVVIVDPKVPTVSWHLDRVSLNPSSLDRPHGARINARGELILFDNGWHRGRSRVLIVDPLNNNLLRVEDGKPEPFFTRTRGFAQDLGAGRLLVTLSEEGRVLELDSDGRVLFEWWSQFRSQGHRSALYRVLAAPQGFPPN